jgi:hypothetical protein
MQRLYNITQINPSEFETQVYTSEDTNVLSTYTLPEVFNESTDYIEYYIYDANKSLIYDTNQNFTGYTTVDNQVSIDPIQNIEEAGYEEGTYYTVYNFLTNLLGSSRNRNY